MSNYLNREVTGKFSKQELANLRECFEVIADRHKITGLAKEQAWQDAMTSPRRALTSLSTLASVPHCGEPSKSRFSAPSVWSHMD